MTILVDFSERMRGESRMGFIKRKLEQAHEEAVNTNSAVILKGFFYDSDLEHVKRFSRDLVLSSCLPRKGGGYLVTYTITPETCIL